MAKYNIPETYQDAITRKEKVLELISSYNEALFSDEPLPFTDEEIRDLQDEYNFLDEFVGLTETEKEAHKKTEVVEYEEIEKEDGTTEKIVKKTFLDKVNPLIFLYGVISIIGSLNVVIGTLSTYFLTWFIKLADKFNWSFETWESKDFDILFIGIICVYPLVFLLFTFLLVRFICRKKETKLVGYIILGLQFVISLINIIFVSIEVIG